MALANNGNRVVGPSMTSSLDQHYDFLPQDYGLLLRPERAKKRSGKLNMYVQSQVARCRDAFCSIGGSYLTIFTTSSRQSVPIAGIDAIVDYIFHSEKE